MSASKLHFGGWRLRQARKRLLDTALRYGDVPYCARCHQIIDPTLSGLHPDGATVGHRVPVSLGGDDSFDNLQLEHRRCNLAAAARVAPPRATVVEPIDGMHEPQCVLPYTHSLSCWPPRATVVEPINAYPDPADAR